MRLIVDIETDSLEVDQVKNIWCVVCKDIETNKVFAYEGLTNECKTLLSSSTSIIGHNFINYDYCVIERFAPGTIDPLKVVDTLVLSKLLKYKLDDGEGHSLEAWGARFNSPKHPSPDFSVYSVEMLEYCKQDVEINHLLYEYLKKYLNYPNWYQAIETEMSMAWICLDMHLNGFKYDIYNANELLQDLEARLGALDNDIIACFPPRLRAVREVTPKATKHGTISKTSIPRSWTDLTKLHIGCPFTIVDYVHFNPGSSRQIVERLNEAGWHPINPTKTGKSWKIDEQNLATLPETAPEGARKLVERLLIAARVRTLKEWEACYNPNTERIHGIFNSIGTWPGRMSHRNPNLGNVATRKSIKYKGARLKEIATNLGSIMRSLWVAADDCWLVGTDMEAAHVRLFAHYIDDKEFTNAVISGNKKLGTDVHTLGARLFKHLGCDRDQHKTFIFSFFNGAGPPKVAEIFGCSVEEARRALGLYGLRFPGIEKLRRELIPIYARQGWFPGLDGREVPYGEEHGMFAGMLQSGEAIVMKMANILWRKELNEKGFRYKQVNLVHDEYVTESLGGRDNAETIGRVQSNSISTAGILLGLRCPLAGEYKVGKTWLAVH